MADRIELVIFDCDGVLVDTELAIMHVYLKAVRELGYNEAYSGASLSDSRRRGEWGDGPYFGRMEFRHSFPERRPAACTILPASAKTRSPSCARLFMRPV